MGGGVRGRSDGCSAINFLGTGFDTGWLCLILRPQFFCSGKPEGSTATSLL
jgi:hypothetical protein